MASKYDWSVAEANPKTYEKLREFFSIGESIDILKRGTAEKELALKEAFKKSLGRSERGDLS